MCSIRLLAFVLEIAFLFKLINCNHSIGKRSLLFPRATVLQLNYGLSVPLILPRRSINFSVVAQVNYNLPNTLENLQFKTIQARESNFDLTREQFYKYLIEILNSLGLEGEECLLRSICEIAKYPMHVKDETILEKVVHYAFTPSIDRENSIIANSTNESLANNYLKSFLEAEYKGQTKGNCRKTYSNCLISLVDLFTVKYFF